MSRIAVWPELKSIADSLACFYETNIQVQTKPYNP